MEKRNRKNILWNIIGSTSNAFVSLILLIIMTRVNGSAEAGVFTYGFSVACLLYFIVNYCGRTFQVTDVKREFSDKTYILNRIISFVMMLMVLGIFLLVNSFDRFKLMVIVLAVLYRCIDGFSEVFYGILQREGYLYKTGISLTLKCLCSVIFFGVVDYFTNDLVLSLSCIVIIDLLILLCYDFGSVKSFINRKDKVSIKGAFVIFKKTFFIFALSFLSIYLTNLTKYAMDVTPSDMQNVYGIILMPASFVSLCATYLINPYMNDLSLAYKNKEKKKFSGVMKKLIGYVIVVGIMAMIGVWLVGPMVLHLLYGLDFSSYRIHLEIIIVGAVFYSLIVILSNVLTIIRKTFAQFLIYLVASIIGYFVCNYMVSRYLIMGASVSYLLVMFICCMLYCLYCVYLLKKEGRENERKNY